MQVSISKAADMVGVTRATFYRHIEKKGISLVKDDDGNPKVDVSELVRVYKHRVRMPEEGNEMDTPDTDKIKQPEHHDTPGTIQVGIEVLRERIRNLEADRQRSEQERNRERDQLFEQIDSLKSHLTSSQEQQKRLTVLLTDQRQIEGRGETEKDQRLDDLYQLIEKHAREREEYDKRMQALEQRIAEMNEKKDSLLKSASEKNKRLLEENRRLQAEASKGLWNRIFNSGKGAA